MKTDLFQSCGHCWVFLICWHSECSSYTASSFRIWNRSAGIPSLPLALFIVMPPQDHLTSHSRMSGFRWVITPWIVKSIINWTVIVLGASQVELVVKNLPFSAGDMGHKFDYWVGKIPCRWKWQPMQYSCLESPMDRGTCWATIHGVTQSWTLLKWLSAVQHMVVLSFKFWGLYTVIIFESKLP